MSDDSNVISFGSRKPLNVEREEEEYVVSEMTRIRIEEQVELLEAALEAARAGRYTALTVAAFYQDEERSGFAWEVWSRPPVTGSIQFDVMSAGHAFLAQMFNEMKVDMFPTLNIKGEEIAPPADEEDFYE